MIKVFKRIVLLAVFLLSIHLLCLDRAYGQATNDYYRRVVQTLLDSEKGVSSSGIVSVSDQEASSYLRLDTVNSKTYSKSYLAQEYPPRGTFKITVGSKTMSSLKRQWWKQLPVQMSSPNTELWYRSVTMQSKVYVELLLRQRFENLFFELFMLFDSIKDGKPKIVDRYKLFLKNARINGLFLEQKIKRIDVSGTWSGPMRNSKGGTAASSMLILKPEKNGAIRGAWHAGWKIERGVQKGNIVTWEHRGIDDGCRDYKCQFIMANDRNKAVLNYKVTDHCKEPSTYDGVVNLRRK